MPKRRSAYIALLIATAIWGFAGPVIKFTLGFVPPFTFLFYRFLLSSLVIVLTFIWHLRKNSIRIKDLPKLTFLAILATTINLGLIFLGFDKTSALDGTLINSLTPIFIVIGGVMFLKEKVTKIERIGLAIAITGTTVTILQPFLEEAAFARQNLIGNLLILTAGIEWAAYTLIAKEDLRKHPPFLHTAWSSFVALATFLPLALWENPNFLAPAEVRLVLTNSGALLGIGFMAIFSYLIAYYTHYVGLRTIEASETALFVYLQPLFAAPLAIFWLGEPITFPFLVGAILIALGVFLTEYKPRRREIGFRV